MPELGGETRRARDRGKQGTKGAGYSDEKETEGSRGLRGQETEGGRRMRRAGD